MCKAYVSKINRRYGAYIGYDLNAGNNFKGRPKLGHELSGIIIAAGAIIGKNCFIEHQVTIGKTTSTGNVNLNTSANKRDYNSAMKAAKKLKDTQQKTFVVNSLKKFKKDSGDGWFHITDNILLFGI